MFTVKIGVKEAVNEVIEDLENRGCFDNKERKSNDN